APAAVLDRRSPRRLPLTATDYPASGIRGRGARPQLSARPSPARLCGAAGLGTALATSRSRASLTGGPMKTTLRSIAALAAVAVALGGCGTVPVNPIAQFIDDSATTTAVKTRLATECNIGSLTGIGVSTRDDVVRLTGTVATQAERQ